MRGNNKSNLVSMNGLKSANFCVLSLFLVDLAALSKWIVEKKGSIWPCKSDDVSSSVLRCFLSLRRL